MSLHSILEAFPFLHHAGDGVLAAVWLKSTVEVIKAAL